MSPLERYAKARTGVTLSRPAQAVSEAASNARSISLILATVAAIAWLALLLGDRWDPLALVAGMVATSAAVGARVVAVVGAMLLALAHDRGA